MVGNPVSKLIRNVLLQDRHGGTTVHSDETYTLKWLQNNDLNIYYVAVYRKTYMLNYVELLLDKVDRKFVSSFKAELRSNPNTEFDFTAPFEKLYDQAETEAKNAPKMSKSRQEIDLKKERAAGQKNAAKRAEEAREAKREAAAEAAAAEAAAAEAAASSPDGAMRKKLEAMKKKKGGDMMERKGSKKAEKGKPGKVLRTWDDAGPTKGEAKVLDYSATVDEESAEAKAAFAAKVAAKRAEFGADDAEMEESDDELSEDDDEAAAESSRSGGGLFGYLKAKLGQAPLTAEDLAPAMEAFQSQLKEKNVASDTATLVVESVRQSLVGKTLGTFTGVSSTFKGSLRTTLERILTPKRSTDILRGVDQAKARKEPYVIVVCGVNGVGKSTSLSKLAHWLMANNAGKVMITACDTFRSGAVEQLRVHAECLDVHLYAEGYAKDAAVVAANGVAYAKREGYDVVLIDTAGRMQNNGPLMAALAKLIDMNQPQLVLFVGEALVGSDGVDQVKMFNQALEDNSLSKTPRLLDGIILTKFDTIDDKVGAAISMCYTTGKPIFFIGTGQRYVDFKRMNVKRVINSLLL